MCTRKDIAVILEQLQQCRDRAGKRRMLEQLTGCKTCTERPAARTQAEARCRCEEYHHIELLNLFEHVNQHSGFKKTPESK